VAQDERALVIIPTYNEKENIRSIVELVLTQAPNLEVLVVDDNSPDGTAAIVTEMAQANPRVHLLSRAGKLGLGTAYIAGFKWGLAQGYAYLIEMDADFSHDPREIPNMLKAIQQADLRWCARRQLAALATFLSKGASYYVRIITGLPIHDPTGGFKCFRRIVLESIELDEVRSNGYAFQIEMSFKAWMKGFRIREIPITFADRHAGQSKMSGHIIQEALWMVWSLAFSHGFRRKPHARPKTDE